MMISESQLQESKVKIGSETLKPILTEKPDHNLGTTWQAAVLEYNPLVAGGRFFASVGSGIAEYIQPQPGSEFLNNLSQQDNSDDYDPLTPQTIEGIPEEYWGRLQDARNASDTAKIRDGIMRSMDNQRILDESGWWGTGFTFGASIASPAMFIPVYNALRYATLGQGFIKGVAGTAPASFTGAAVDNALLTLGKETQGMQDFIKNTIIEGTIGSAIGGTVGLLKARNLKLIRADMESKFEGVKINTALNEDGSFSGFRVDDSSISSQQVKTRVQKLLDDGIADIREDGALGRLFDLYFGASPVVRGLRSPFATVREWTNGIFNHNFVTGRIASGEAPLQKAEDIVNQYSSKYDKLITLNRDSYSYYKRNQMNNGQLPPDVLSPVEFREAIGKSLRRGDKSDVPEVADMANLWREQIIEPLKNDLIRLGRMSPNVATKTAESYFMRVYNKQMVIQKRGDFHSILKDHYTSVNNQLKDIYAPIDNLKAELKTLKKEVRGLKDKSSIADRESKIKSQIESLEARLESDLKSGKFDFSLISDGKLRKVIGDDHIDQAVESTIETILNESDEQLMNSLFQRITSRGNPSPLKERVLMIPDEQIENFLVSDVDRVMSIYQGGLSRVVGLDTFFSRFDDDATTGRESFVAKLTEEYRQQRFEVERQPESKAKSKALSKLDESYKKAQNFIKETEEVFLGTYGMPTTKVEENVRDFLRGAQNYNVGAKLGYLGIVSLTELGAPVFRQGMQYIQEGLIPTLSNLRRLRRKGDVVREDFMDAGLAIQTALNSRIRQVGDANLDYQPTTYVGSFMKQFANISGILSGANLITDFAELATATASQSRTMRSLFKVQSGKSLTQKEIERFGLLGLDYKKYGQRMIDQFEKYGHRDGGSFVPNFSRWDDLEASNAFSNSLRREVTSVITRRNMLDVPLSFRNPVISTLTQFMGWGFSATNNFVIPLLQRFDANKLAGILSMMAIGSLVYPLKQFSRTGDWDQVDLSFETLLKEAIFNSGTIGWQPDVVNRINSALDLPILRSLQAEKYRKRYGRSAWGLVGGPFAGTVDDVFAAAGMVASGEWNENDMKRLMDLVPYTNAFYFSWLKNQAREGMQLPRSRATAQRLDQAVNQ